MRVEVGEIDQGPDAAGGAGDGGGIDGEIAFDARDAGAADGVGSRVGHDEGELRVIGEFEGAVIDGGVAGVGVDAGEGDGAGACLDEIGGGVWHWR